MDITEITNEIKALWEPYKIWFIPTITLICGLLFRPWLDRSLEKFKAKKSHELNFLLSQKNITYQKEQEILDQIWGKIDNIDLYGGIGSDEEVIDDFKKFFKRNKIHIEPKLANKLEEMINLNYEVYNDNKDVIQYERNMDMEAHSNTSDNIDKNINKIKILYQDIEKEIQERLWPQETS